MAAKKGRRQKYLEICHLQDTKPRVEGLRASVFFTSEKSGYASTGMQSSSLQMIVNEANGLRNSQFGKSEPVEMSVPKFDVNS
mmetsp:Transcript_60184/g.107218  ORF Transcript_60184/g.107218 Transcript_60184/m.107218 type:complete len:83 (+) Transcript_60184:346-594(+)